jgi:hypothetical protein
VPTADPASVVRAGTHSGAADARSPCDVASSEVPPGACDPMLMRLTPQVYVPANPTRNQCQDRLRLMNLA